MTYGVFSDFHTLQILEKPIQQNQGFNSLQSYSLCTLYTRAKTLHQGTNNQPPLHPTANVYNSQQISPTFVISNQCILRSREQSSHSGISPKKLQSFLAIMIISCCSHCCQHVFPCQMSQLLCLLFGGAGILGNGNYYIHSHFLSLLNIKLLNLQLSHLLFSLQEKLYTITSNLSFFICHIIKPTSSLATCYHLLQSYPNNHSTFDG